jgi:hypothetical protein
MHIQSAINRVQHAEFGSSSPTEELGPSIPSDDSIQLRVYLFYSTQLCHCDTEYIKRTYSTVRHRAGGP